MHSNGVIDVSAQMVEEDMTKNSDPKGMESLRTARRLWNKIPSDQFQYAAVGPGALGCEDR